MGLGSNMGDRFTFMCMAVEYLRNTGLFTDIRLSSLYETAPVGYMDQPPFLNAAFRARTEMPPLELLDVCRRVEHHLDRVRVIRWGPRTIDADILLYDFEEIDLPDLTVPHPRMFERNFVLIPLMEVCSEEVSSRYRLPQRSAGLADQGIKRLEKNETIAEWHSPRY